ncbi:MAG: hypothetical protein M3R38_12470 [Actinomycetota bacterium]|nr:hypothetical protein [Actinomycetota bacterium]
MRAANLTPLLVRARDAGLSLRAEGGCVVASPRALLAPELREEIARHKAGLLEVLRWDEDAAVALLKAAAEYLEDAYLRAGSPDLPEDPFLDAHAARDMFAYRIAVREWVQETRASLREIERARALYLPKASPSSPTPVMEGATV